jgi:DNA-binding HxlR family transcriptional regulator
MLSLASRPAASYGNHSMTTPLPTRRVRGSATGRPVMALLDLLGRRMALRILWELRDRPLTFRALQQAAETNPSVLNTRLGELREAFIVEHGPEGYGLTLHGRTLLELLLPLHAWADEWARRLERGSGAGIRPSSRKASAAGSAGTSIGESSSPGPGSERCLRKRSHPSVRDDGSTTAARSAAARRRSR